MYLLWRNTLMAPLTKDMTGFAAEPVCIDPSGSRPGPDGKPISQIGHAGATIRKIGKKYVHFGTAGATDRLRKGTCNLYYCTSGTIPGPYGPRRFAGRFLGHGTLFQEKADKWWRTAFFNANEGAAVISSYEFGTPENLKLKIESRGDVKTHSLAVNELTPIGRKTQIKEAASKSSHLHSTNR